ncbi:MAG: hypothetical protein ACRBCS_16285, partial [Cellvibrionaceae bacterium]
LLLLFVSLDFRKGNFENWVIGLVGIFVIFCTALLWFQRRSTSRINRRITIKKTSLITPKNILTNKRKVIDFRNINSIERKIAPNSILLGKCIVIWYNDTSICFFSSLFRHFSDGGRFYNELKRRVAANKNSQRDAAKDAAPLL